MEQIEEAGYQLWIDKREILGGQNWGNQVAAAISESDAFIVVLSPSSVNSKFVRIELEHAINEGKRIVPIILKPAEMPPALNLRLGRYQAINLESAQGFTQLLEALGRQKKIAQEVLDSASPLGNSLKYFFFGTPFRVITTISSAVALIGYFFSFTFISRIDPPSPPDRITELVRGKIAHHVPDTMTVDLDTQIWVHISKALNDSILLEGRSAVGVVIDAILVSSSVNVSLIDPSPDIDKNFHIAKLSPDRQSVDDSTSTIWEWNVRPLKAGTFPLRISAEVDVINEFGRLPKYVPVYDDEVYVEAVPFRDTKNFFQKYWQWLITVIGIPLLSLLGKKIFQQRKKRREKWAKERKEAEDRKKIAGMS